MLQSIRDRAQGWIAWIIVGFIILTFALFGVQEYFGINEQPAVATVNDTKITQNDFQRAVQRQRQNFQSILGANYDPKMFDSPMVRQNIVNELVNDALLMSAITDNKLALSERQIAEIITSFSQFQQAGKFSEELFAIYLNSEGLTQEQFIYRLGGDLLRQQFYQGITTSGLVTPNELVYQTSLMSQTRDVGYMEINYRKLLDRVKVSEQDIANYYQSNSQQFLTDEKVAVEYVELSLVEMAKNITASEIQLKEYYETNKSQYVAPEQRKASHILIELAVNASDKDVTEQTQKAQVISAELNSGADFVAYAKKYSTDIGSANNGGDIGYVVPGSGLPKSFVDSVFSLKLNQVSAPVRTESGIHIIKLTEIKRPQKSFQQVRAQLEKDYRLRQSEANYFKLAEEMVNISNEQPESLEAVAQELGLKLQKTGLFARNNATGILAQPKVLAEAFNKDLIQSRYNSEAIELGAEHILVLRVKDHQAAVIRPLDEVKDSIVNRLKRDMAIKMAAENADKYLAKLIAGDSPQSIAKSAGTTWIEKKSIKRSDVSQVEAAIINRAFTLPKSETRSYATVRLASGNHAIVSVSGVQDGKSQVLNAEQAKRAYAEDGSKTYNQYIQYLKDKADISYNYDLLK